MPSTNNPVAAAQAEFENRRAVRQAQKLAAMKTARRLAWAIVSGADEQPNPAEIIGLCDELGVDADWFDAAVDACRRRSDELAGAATIPDLRAEVASLDAEAAKLESECGQKMQQKQRLFDAIKGYWADTKTGPWRDDVTPEELSAHRRCAGELAELQDHFWLARRNARQLRAQIAELAKVDRENIDHDCVEKAPMDFRMPPME